jgi:hypothetical protein
MKTRRDEEEKRGRKAKRGEARAEGRGVAKLKITNRPRCGFQI